MHKMTVPIVFPDVVALWLALFVCVTHGENMVSTQDPLKKQKKQETRTHCKRCKAARESNCSSHGLQHGWFPSSSCGLCSNNHESSNACPRSLLKEFTLGLVIKGVCRGYPYYRCLHRKSLLKEFTQRIFTKRVYMRNSYKWCLHMKSFLQVFKLGLVTKDVEIGNPYLKCLHWKSLPKVFTQEILNK